MGGQETSGPPQGHPPTWPGRKCSWVTVAVSLCKPVSSTPGAPYLGWGGRQRNNEGRECLDPPPNSPQVTVLQAGAGLAPLPPERARAEHPWQRPMPQPARIHRALPTGMPRVRMQPARGRGGCARARPAPALCHPLLPQLQGRGRAEAAAAGWGLACAGTASLTRLVPAPPPATPLSRNRGRTRAAAPAPRCTP